jgi:hypothetical protein
MIDPPRRIAAAVAGVGVVLCVLGWYQISGQPTVPQQLPYLASATIPGAALLVVGLVLLLRGPLPRESARRYAVRSTGATGSPSTAAFVRVPDGRYLHVPDCPLLDGRTDVIAVGPAEPAESAESATSNESAAEAPAAPLRPCPLCHPGAVATDSTDDDAGSVERRRG